MHSSGYSTDPPGSACKDNLVSEIQPVKDLASILGVKSMTFAGGTGSNKDENELIMRGQRVKEGKTQDAKQGELSQRLCSFDSELVQTFSNQNDENICVQGLNTRQPGPDGINNKPTEQGALGVTENRNKTNFQKKQATQTQLRTAERNKRPYKPSQFQLMAPS